MRKTLIASLLALVSFSALAEMDFYVVVPLKGRTASTASQNITVSLNPGAMPVATVGKAYSFDLSPFLQVTGDPQLTLKNASWSLTGLPAGLASTGGLISGTPTVANDAGAPVNVKVNYKTKTGAQTYILYVNGVAFEAASLSMNRSHACGITPAGALKCWGNNAYGQLGNGTQNLAFVPNQVQGLTSVKSVATGNYHSCAVTTAGAAYCWGYDGMGQIGDGQAGSINITVPKLVTGLSTGVQSIAAGASTTCAVMADSSVKCWGYNDGGTLGTGDWNQYYATPQTVVGLSGATKVVVSNSTNACALINNGSVKCWGSGGMGTNGDGTANNRNVPASVIGLPGSVVDLSSSGGYSICAVMSTGKVMCWGSDSDGQLGNGAPAQNSSVPVEVTGLSNASQVVQGETSACAVTGSGAVYCWGNNAYGQLGQGNTSAVQYAPVKVQDAAPYASVTMGRYGACGVTVSGIGKCWGYNFNAILGTGSSGEYLYTPGAIQPAAN